MFSPNLLPIQFKLRNPLHLKQRFLKISGKKIINVTLFFILTPAPIPREALIPVPSGVGVTEGVSGLSPSRWALFPHRRAMISGRPLISDQHKPHTRWRSRNLTPGRSFPSLTFIKMLGCSKASYKKDTEHLRKPSSQTNSIWVNLTKKVASSYFSSKRKEIRNCILYKENEACFFF